MMSNHAATLQIFNQEFVKCLEHLKERRDDLKAVISRDTEEKHKLEQEIDERRNKLEKINKSLVTYNTVLQNYDDMIKESEAGFAKLLESSHILLSLIKQEAAALDQKMCNS